MRPSTSLVVALAAFTPLAAAWPDWLPDIDALVARQDDSGNTAEASATATDGEASAQPTATNTRSSSNDEEDISSITGTGTNTARQTDLNTAKIPSGTGTRTSTRTTKIDPNAAAGGVVMITPAVTDPALRLYKVGENVTFSWNYTNLLDAPTAVDVLATVSTLSRTWTLTQNMTYETLGSFVWDTEPLATNVQSPLLTDQYTLVIYDAESAITDTPEPGKLGLTNSLTFGMYIPQEYVPFKDWKCPTCSAAPPSLSSQSLGLAVTMSLATVLGLGVLL